MKTLALKFIIIIAVKDHGANSFESRGHLGLHCQTKKKMDDAYCTRISFRKIMNSIMSDYPHS